MTRRRPRKRTLGVVAAAVVVALSVTARNDHRPHKLTQRQQFSHALNRTRERFDLGGLSRSVRLERLCGQHSRMMAATSTLQHDGFALRAAQANLRRINESVSYQYGAPNGRGTLRQFMRSPPHRANMLALGVNRVGVSASRHGRIVYWCVLIGGR